MIRYAVMGASWIFKAALVVKGVFVGELEPLLAKFLPLNALDELAKARSPTRADRPSLPPEAKAVSAQFAEFLKTRVKSVGITDLSRNIQSFIDKVVKDIRDQGLISSTLNCEGAQESRHLAHRTSFCDGAEFLSGVHISRFKVFPRSN